MAGGDARRIRGVVDDLKLMIVTPALAPYRIDVFNAIAERIQLRVIFLMENLPYEQLDQASLRRRMKADSRYLLNGFSVMGRTIRLGIGEEISDFRPDVIMTPEFSPMSLAIWLRKRILCPSYAHLVFVTDNPESVGRDAWIRKLGRRCILPSVDGVVTMSDEATGLYRERYGVKAPMAELPNLYSEELFSSKLASAVERARDLCMKHGISGSKVILYVGRLVSVKGLERLLKGCRPFLLEDPRLKLVLVGDGPERASLGSLAAALGIGDKVIWPGRCEGESLYAWYLLGSLFVLPSRWEPFGAVVTEALLSGMPVICSRMAGARSLITDGTNGTVIDMDDTQGFHMACREWLDKVSAMPANCVVPRRPSLLGIGLDDVVSRFVAMLELVRQGRGRKS